MWAFPHFLFHPSLSFCSSSSTCSDFLSTGQCFPSGTDLGNLSWSSVQLVSPPVPQCYTYSYFIFAYICISSTNPTLLACFTLPAVFCFLVVRSGDAGLEASLSWREGNTAWELVRAIQHIICGRQLRFLTNWCAEVLVKYRMSSYWGVRALLLAMMKCLERWL